MKLWDRLAALFAPTVTITRTVYTRPMTAAEAEAFDRAFAKFNDAFDEMGKAFSTLDNTNTGDRA